MPDNLSSGGVRLGHSRMNNQVDGTCRKTRRRHVNQKARKQACACMDGCVKKKCSIDLQPAFCRTGTEMGYGPEAEHVSPYFGHRPVVDLGPKGSKFTQAKGICGSLA